MGRLLGIACIPQKRASAVAILRAEVTPAEGILGDARGAKPDRQITILFREGWDDACSELGVALPWVTRRANLLVEGLPVPREGARLTIGAAILEVTQETQPCSLMERAHRGLKRALTPDWRGGVCCRVIAGGTIQIGDSVEVS